MRVETIHPDELGSGEIALWRAYQQANPTLASPYLAPEWAQLIGRARADARVCVIDGGAGFLGAQRLSRFAAMGLGAPIADYQGVVSEACLDVDAAAICRALKVGRIDLSHVPAGQSILAGAISHGEGSWIAETFGCRDLYEAALRLQRGEFLRQTDKKLRKLARERQPPEFSLSTDRGALAILLAWKRRHLGESGQPQIWDTPWVRRTLDACFEARTPNFAGALFTMRVGDRLAAANFCLRSAHTLHMWVMGHDESFESFSPGIALARWIVGWAGEHGIAEVDFGPGEYRFKRQLSTTQRKLEWGVAAGPSWSGAVRRAEFALRAGMERFPQPELAALPGKAMRRLDLMRALAA